VRRSDGSDESDDLRASPACGTLAGNDFDSPLTSQTPVCTTELSAVALSYADFQSRGVKVGQADRLPVS
jgi:hypothetical protein